LNREERALDRVPFRLLSTRALRQQCFGLPPG
jgi:hypothetical protein